MRAAESVRRAPQEPERGDRLRWHSWWRRRRPGRRAVRVVDLIRLIPAGGLRLTVALVTLVAVSGAAPVVSMLAIGELIGSLPATVHVGLQSGPGRHTLWLLAFAAVALLAEEVSSRLLSVVAEAVGRRVDLHLQRQVIQAVNRPWGVSHLEDPAVADLLAQAEGLGSTGFTPGGAVTGVASRASHVLQGVGATALLVPFRWWMAVGLLVVQIACGRLNVRDYVRQIESTATNAQQLRRSGYFRDLGLTPDAAKEIRVFGLTDWLIERFRGEWRKVMPGIWHQRRGEFFAAQATTAVIFVVNLGAYWTIGDNALHHAIGLGALVVYLRAVAGVSAINQRGPADFQLAWGAAALPAIRGLEAYATPPDPGQGRPVPKDAPTGPIVFRGVSFAYPGQLAPVFEGLDLVLPAGRCTAVVGANGVGKTTLVKLLCRLYDPDAGAVTVDGVDLKEMDAGAWQRRVAAIFQDFVRYELGARENIGFGAPDLTGEDGALLAAADKAGITARIQALPAGFDTPLARHLPGGAELSGGEWQRIALARALFAVGGGARVLILDEPTANLDVRAEAQLYDRFLELTAGLTTVLISHRFSTVRRADRICVLEAGRVVEAGTHDQLMRQSGRYATMFRLQSSMFFERSEEPA